MAEHVNAGLNFDQALLGFAQLDSSRQKKTCDGLHVAATQKSPRAKFVVFSARVCHSFLKPILNPESAYRFVSHSLGATL
jgi:hypothetical protein